MNRKENKLHIFINNAGVSTSSRSETLSPTDEKKIMCPPYSETKQGFEIVKSIERIGHVIIM
jgi:hypothetical protein